MTVVIGESSRIYPLKNQGNRSFRRPIYSASLAKKIIYLFDEKKLSPGEIAKVCLISSGTVYYYLNQTDHSD